MGRSLQSERPAASGNRRARIPRSLVDGLVLQVLSGSSVPLSSYALTERVKALGGPSNVPSIYRSLDRLVGLALIERVEALSAYCIKTVTDPVIAICARCGSTTAFDFSQDRARIIQRLARTTFLPSRLVVEVIGLCESCRT